MTKGPGRMVTLYAELKRRKVVRTVIAYAVFAGAIIQLTGPIADGLGLPAATLTYVIYAAAAGLPIAIILAWIFEVSRQPPSDIHGTEIIPAAESPLLPRPRVYTSDTPLTKLVGREADVDAALRVLADDAGRALTLTGPGGIGKTRLAQEIANRASPQFRHGACFVALAGVESVASIPAVIADALGFTLSAESTPARQLAGFLQEKELLLVLDNFEQLVDGAGLLSELVMRAKGLRLLITSRRRLRIDGETVLPLQALSLPTPGSALTDSAAARLFLQIARRSDPRFEPDEESAAAIVRICDFTDGIPLAIELAAACVGLLSCVEIARELEQSHEIVVGARRDLPPRHQTLHTAFDSSWRLLDPEERRGFRGLSVFRSAFDRESARAIAGTELSLLARLVEASLVYRSANAFEILEVLRQFGEEKLDEEADEAADVRKRHSHYFLGRLAALDIVPEGATREAAIDGLAQHSADLSAAWMRAAADHAFADLHAAAGGLFSLLHARGRNREGADLLAYAAAAVRPAATGTGPDADEARATLARLLSRRATFLVDLGSITEAADLLAEALILLRADGDRGEIAFVKFKQCVIARTNGDVTSSVFDESLALYRELDDLPGVARALNGLGTARQATGRYDEAKQLYNESVQLFRRIGLSGEAWMGLNNLAGMAQLEGDSATARRILEDEMEAARKRNNPRALSFLLTNLAFITSSAGDLVAAQSYLDESVALAREMGHRGRLAYCLNTLGNVHVRSGHLDEAARTFQDALTTAIDAEEGPLVPAILVGIARLYIARGEPQTAARILKAVEAHGPCDEQTRQEARTVLDTLDAGPIPAMSLEEAVAAQLV